MSGPLDVIGSGGGGVIVNPIAPVAPANGAIWYDTATGTLKVWDTTVGGWTVITSGGGGGTTGATVSTTAPVAPSNGQLWYNPTTSILQVASGGVWSPTGGSGSGVVVAAVAPTTPAAGALWFDTTAAILKVYASGAWVSADSPAITVSGAAPSSPGVGHFFLNIGVNPNILQVWTGSAWLTVDRQASIAATPPTFPGLGNTWLDTSVTPNALKVWDGGAWVSPAPAIAVGPVAPTVPASGNLWLDTSNSAAPLLKVRNGTSWLTVNSGVTSRSVTAGADRGSVEATFNSDAITVGRNDVVIYKYLGASYLYTGAAGAPVTGATAAMFSQLSSASVVDTQYVALGAAADIGAAWAALAVKPSVSGSVVTFATFAGDTYVLTVESNPSAAGSWTKVGSAPVIGTTVGTAAPVSPSIGSLWYDTTNSAFKVYNGSAWVATAPTPSPGAGNAGRVATADAAGVVTWAAPAGVDTQIIALGAAADIGAAWTALTTKPTVTGLVVTFAAFAGDVYVLTVESAPGAAASWTRVSGTAGGGGVTVSASAPLAPANGALWYDTGASSLKMWNTATSGWIAITGGAGVTVSGTAPTSPTSGALWYDTTTSRLKLWDSAGAAWVTITGSTGATVNAAAPVSPTSGALWYDTTASAFKVYSGSAWISTAGVAAPAAGADGRVATADATGAVTWAVPATVDTQLIALGAAADIGAAWAALATKPTVSGSLVTFATFSGETYVLTAEAAPGVAASWLKIASTPIVPAPGAGAAGRVATSDAAGAITWTVPTAFDTQSVALAAAADIGAAWTALAVKPTVTGSVVTFATFAGDSYVLVTESAPASAASWVKLSGASGPAVSASAPTTAAIGDLWYDTGTNVLKAYNGSAWLAVSSVSAPGTGAAGRVATADAAGAVTWALPSGVTARGVNAGADKGSVEATFNADAVTVGRNDVVIYKYLGSAYLYTGAAGAPVVGATAAMFTQLSSAAVVDTQYVALGTAADIGAAWTALASKPSLTGAVVTFATFGGETYVLTTEAAPGTAGSWTKTGSTALHVVGPASATANAVARFDAATGKLIKNSVVILTDTGNMTGVVDLTTTGNTVLGDAATDTVRLNAGVAGRAAHVVSPAIGVMDLSVAQMFTNTATAANTWSFTNTPAGLGVTVVLVLTNGGVAAQTWPASVKWPGGTAPTLTAAGVDVLVFVTNDGGTTWRANVFGKDMK